MHTRILIAHGYIVAQKMVSRNSCRQICVVLILMADEVVCHEDRMYGILDKKNVFSPLQAGEHYKRRLYYGI